MGAFPRAFVSQITEWRTTQLLGCVRVEVSPTKLALKIFFLLVCALASFVLAAARGVLAQSAAQKSVEMPNRQSNSN